MSGRHRGRTAGSATPCWREIDREARRILPVLSKPGALARADAARPGRVHVFTRRGQRRPSATVAEPVLAAMGDNGWVEDAGEGTWRISEAGRRWLERRLGSDGFADQHRLIDQLPADVPVGDRQAPRFNAGEDPLGWLARRRDRDGQPLLTAEMVAAGERVRADFTRAGLAPSVTTDWSSLHRRLSRRGGTGGHGSGDLTDSAVAARQRLQRALQALSPEAAGLVVDVCCFLVGLETAESSRRWPKRSAKLVLRLSLDQLARHYGIVRS